MASYHAFLLRIWHSGDGAVEQWAIRLQHVPDGRVARLANLDGLVDYLQAVLGGEGADRHPDPESRASADGTPPAAG